MLDADVDPFLNVPVSDALVDDDPDGGFSHVVDDTGFAMVDFMRHAEENISNGRPGRPEYEEGLTLSERRHWL